MTIENTVARPIFDEQSAQLATARALLDRCQQGFGAYIHGRKMARKDRDKLRADIENFLLGRRYKSITSP